MSRYVRVDARSTVVEEVWIVQEAVLSPNTTLHIGTNEVALSPVLFAFTTFIKHSSNCCNSCYRLWQGGHRIRKIFNDAEDFVGDLGVLIEAYQDDRLYLHNIFFASRLREVSDPHDYVYGFRGLLHDS